MIGIDAAINKPPQRSHPPQAGGSSVVPVFGADLYSWMLDHLCKHKHMFENIAKPSQG